MTFGWADLFGYAGVVANVAWLMMSRRSWFLAGHLPRWAPDSSLNHVRRAGILTVVTSAVQGQPCR